jgi:hypothetical protein
MNHEEMIASPEKDLGLTVNVLRLAAGDSNEDPTTPTLPLGCGGCRGCGCRGCEGCRGCGCRGCEGCRGCFH